MYVRRQSVNFGSFLEQLQACGSGDSDDHASGGDDHEEEDEKAEMNSPAASESSDFDAYAFQE